MNSLTPAAQVRAGTGFQNVKARSRGIVPYAWNRSLLWLLVRFLPVVILTLIPATPSARAQTQTATKPCQDGAVITVDGTINKFVREANTRFYITDTGLDCDRLYFLAASEQSCVLGSHIHASGTLSKPVATSPRVEWSLTNPTFSCQ